MTAWLICDHCGGAESVSDDELRHVLKKNNETGHLEMHPVTQQKCARHYVCYQQSGKMPRLAHEVPEHMREGS